MLLEPPAILPSRYLYCNTFDALDRRCWIVIKKRRVTQIWRCRNPNPEMDILWFCVTVAMESQNKKNPKSKDYSCTYLWRLPLRKRVFNYPPTGSEQTGPQRAFIRDTGIVNQGDERGGGVGCPLIPVVIPRDAVYQRHEWYAAHNTVSNAVWCIEYVLGDTDCGIYFPQTGIRDHMLAFVSTCDFGSILCAVEDSLHHSGWWSE